jgi:glutamate/tyrosine decarboxylase-like PLP-dependent enzyme
MSDQGLLVLGILIGVVALWLALAWYKRHKYRKISKRGRQGEADAETLLERLGYTIISRQERGTVRFTVDGQVHESTDRADLIVAKKGRTYVAEVKTGAQANVDLPHVRRQLFEYSHVFETDGILFVDMNTRSVSEVSFEASEDPHFPLGPFLAGAACGIFVVLIIMVLYGSGVMA